MLANVVQPRYVAFKISFGATMLVVSNRSRTLLHLQTRSLTWRNVVFGGPEAFLFFAFVLSLFIQIEILNIGSRSLVAYHLVLALAFVVILCDRVLRNHFRATTLQAFLYAFLTTLIFPAMQSWDFGLSTTLLIFAGVSFAMGLQFGKYSAEYRRKVYEVVMFCFLAAIVIRAATHVGDLGLIYSRGRGCEGCFLATGGRNIEATMFAILALLYRGRYRLSIGILVTVTVVLFQSRVGILGAMTYWVFYARSVGASFVLFACMISIQTALIATLVGSYGLVLNRFDLSTELELLQKGVGRLALWSAAIEAIVTKPFGAGPGNSVNYINSELTRAFWENNIHNVFLTWVLELGWVHGAALILLILRVLFQAVSQLSFIEAPAIMFLILTSIIQFTGYDAIFWFMLATFISAQQSKTASATG